MPKHITDKLRSTIAESVQTKFRIYGLSDYKLKNDKEGFNSIWGRFQEEQKLPAGISYKMLTRVCFTTENLARKRYISICEWLNIPIDTEAYVMDISAGGRK